jgi:hypothetical protein
LLIYLLGKLRWAGSTSCSAQVSARFFNYEEMMTERRVIEHNPKVLSRGERNFAR